MTENQIRGKSNRSLLEAVARRLGYSKSLVAKVATQKRYNEEVSKELEYIHTIIDQYAAGASITINP